VPPALVTALEQVREDESLSQIQDALPTDLIQALTSTPTSLAAWREMRQAQERARR
jgi:hypothetical protein